MKKKVIILIGVLFVIVLVGVLIMNRKKDKEVVLNGNTDFNLDLIKRVNNNSKDNNYLISPYSIEIALSMLRDGANGETYDEITNVIGNRKITNEIIKNRVSVANAAFIKNKYKKYVKKEYNNILKDKYNSEILYDEYKTPKVINDWVNNKTNGMIDKILDEVSDNFVLGIANALSTNIEWSDPFDCNDTESYPFTMIDGEKMQVEMMHKKLQYGGYKYLKDDSATGVIVPYKKYDNNGNEDYENGINLDFVAILPNDNIDNYINNLTNDMLTKLISSGREVNDDFEINLSLPRFKYDYELSNFKNILKELGIKKVFDMESADFTNIMDRNNKIANLYVDTAIHKTHIDLNEKGTKAAAVTYFGMFASGISLDKESIDIKFDKPFIYMIMDSKNNEMLFFGVVYEPNEWNGKTCTGND